MADVTMRVWRGDAVAATLNPSRWRRTRARSCSTSSTASRPGGAGLGLSMEL